MISKSILLILAVLIGVYFSPVQAQHHSGSLAPPVDFDGLKLALITSLTPEDFTLNDSKSANLSVRLFESETNTNVKSVTYRIQIFHGDNLVANEYFFDEDGKLDLQIKPKTQCLEEELWKCTKYFGEKHAIAGAYYARGDSIPVIQGPVFDKSGQYNLKVSIVGATNPKTMTTKDLLFETIVNIPQNEIFLIKPANAQEYPISIKSYDSEVSGFKFDEASDKISFETIPKHEHIDQHESSYRQLIILPKDFLSFRQDYDIDVFVEGAKLDGEFVEFDVSSPNENVIKINIPHEEYATLQKNNDSGSLKVEILSGNFIDLEFLNLKFDNNFAAKVSWDSKSKPGQKIPFVFSFFDEQNNPANMLFAYSVTDSSGNEIWSNIGTDASYIGILATNGIKQESIFIPTYGQYQFKVILTGQDYKNFEEFFASKSDFEIREPDMAEKKNPAIPPWIKSNAGWWANGEIDDSSFVQGIQFLIKEEIMKIPPTTQGVGAGTNQIPSWIKSNAGWWANGEIDDSSFVQGIQYMIKEKIIYIASR